MFTVGLDRREATGLSLKPNCLGFGVSGECSICVFVLRVLSFAF